MNFEQTLIAAIVALAGVVGYLFKIFWDEMRECRQDRHGLRKEVEKLREEVGELNIRRRCDIDECPFRFDPQRHTAPTVT